MVAESVGVRKSAAMRELMKLELYAYVFNFTSFKWQKKFTDMLVHFQFNSNEQSASF